jgi:hypothetical protein
MKKISLDYIYSIYPKLLLIISITTITVDNDKDVEIKREEDLGLDEKIKAGAKAVGRKIGESESDIGSEYDTEKTIERVQD